MKKSYLSIFAVLLLFTVACSDDNAPNLALASLTVNSGTLTPAFDPSVTAYTVSVSNTVEQITITGAAADPAATVVVDPESPADIKTGSNLIMVWVFSADGTDFKVYRISVVKGVSPNANLSSLVISAGSLEPAFDPEVTNYSIAGYVPNNYNNTVIIAAADHAKASITYPVGQIPDLTVGSNQLVIRITAEDGTTTKDYTVQLYRMGADHTSATIGTLKYVPAGKFQRDEMADNISFVSALRMSRTEITRSQYSNVMGADPSDAGFSSGTSDPVQKVNWYHAIAFCNKLSIAEGLTPVYTVAGVNFTNLLHAAISTTSNADWNAATATWSANGYRLPTEMEWMWAAMGVNIGADPFAVNTTGKDKLFAGSTGSNSIGDYVWDNSNSDGKTHPAGSKLPNELGLFDMSGNIWEWIWELDAIYPTGYTIDYKGVASGVKRVDRGSGFASNRNKSEIKYRSSNSPGTRVSDLGIRVVRP